jgi:Tfp pilus assembly protein PilP
MKNTDHELHELHRQLNDPNFHYPKLSNEREEWRGQEARELRDLREQQERNWWLDKQYEWMKKHGGKQEDDPESLQLHIENAEELKKCKIDPESRQKTNPLEALVLIAFFIFLFFAS